MQVRRNVTTSLRNALTAVRGIKPKSRVCQYSRRRRTTSFYHAGFLTENVLKAMILLRQINFASLGC